MREQFVHYPRKIRRVPGRKVILLKELYSLGKGFLCDVFRPQGGLDFHDMRLAQEEHTDKGLADAAADGIGQLLVQDRFLKRQLGAFRTSGFVELAKQGLLIHADSHGRQFQCDIEYRIIDKNIGV